LFVPLNNRKGIKLYRDKEIRDFSYKGQNKAFKLGLGPKTYGKFKLEFPEVMFVYSEHHGEPGCDFKTYYGYITQLAKEPSGKFDKRTYTAAQKLTDKLVANGFADWDVGYTSNVGWVGNKLVCIDFDPITMSGCSC
jgi:hypothetical protein